MAPLTPHWHRPSHPDVQEVIILDDKEFTTKSISRVDLPPFGLLAKMSYPPCTEADAPSYASVQSGKDKHFLLNSDLMYINHSCEPSLIFDTGNSNIIAGPNGLKKGEELTFFYPSTEWHMAQPFDCLCGKPTCRGRISGAKDMKPAQLDGLWLNGHIRELLEEQQQQQQQQAQPATTTTTTTTSNGVVVSEDDETATALREALSHAEKGADAARRALDAYMAASVSAKSALSSSGATRRGPTSRELSGEMGGDTKRGAAVAV
ncbi:uncharacterized protein B0I36DRAFT_379634 [Microdochium trichocladiopsis]|uniref:Post-SET domain-containing protein n=1 Tax=Microdochium trichocladiopsis TaxID=1682393 RepID=A0A9P8YIP2_9PEZI|nr:uncharacterized protein B0I36DRAFT_379634 [Microdochium trichocladiopsis]KAH7040717.1 hypothetical protein B0I36DRAFT_379634 [Microdochium trichocladiopsis]